MGFRVPKSWQGGGHLPHPAHPLGQGKLPLLVCPEKRPIVTFGAAGVQGVIRFIGLKGS